MSKLVKDDLAAVDGGQTLLEEDEVFGLGGHPQAVGAIQRQLQWDQAYVSTAALPQRRAQVVDAQLGQLADAQTSDEVFAPLVKAGSSTR
ncbi:hypothetical protein [Streptomyces lavendofoliae]|uniref:hypothetical protein n=1 Tax=Streptomyces lavendofoliae TaxID=67314 RepID=UPI003D8AFB2A